MKQKNLVLMVVAVGCGLVAAFLTTQINAKPKVEMVPVLVASKDLTVGTTLSAKDLDKYVETKPLAKDVLPPQFVTTKEDLVGKRLSRPILKGETFSPASLVKGPVVTLPQGKDLYSLAMNPKDGAGGFVGPGSKVDILASLQLSTELKTFPLLVDMHVVAVNQTLAYENGKTGFPEMSMISLAVDQEEALLLSLAEKRGCTLKLLLRHDGKPKDSKYNMAEVRKLLADPKRRVVGGPTEDKSGNGDVEPSDIPPVVTPVPEKKEEKKESVKVWVAKHNIPANTTITVDLVKEMFTEEERPKEYAPGACSDLTPHLTKALTHGIAKGQYVTDWSLGEQALKPAPQDPTINGLPSKPGPNDPVTPATPAVRPEPVTPAAPEFHDVAVHTASGTQVHRYMKVKGDWKFVAVLTPEQAARTTKLPAASDKPAGPAKQPVPDASKID